MITAIRHFGIVVSNLQESLRFYRDLLGLKVERETEEYGNYLDNMLGLNNVRVKVAKMSGNDGLIVLELLEFGSPASQPRTNKGPTTIGPTHVAFTVRDLDLVHCRLVKAGVPFNCPPQLAPDKSAKATYCQDPDGTLVELVEMLK